MIEPSLTLTLADVSRYSKIVEQDVNVKDKGSVGHLATLPAGVDAAFSPARERSSDPRSSCVE